MDSFGATSLVIFAIILAFNQVVIKVTNDGVSPVFATAIRSVIGLLAVSLWMWMRGARFEFTRKTLWFGVLSGVVFSVEFISLYLALDLSSVSRVSVIFYSMPVWLALAAHFLLPGERLSGIRLIGLLLAMAGVAIAMADRQGGTANLWGDLLALLAAMTWASIALMLRVTPLATLKPEMQLFWQLAVSCVILGAVAPMFGPLVREFEAIHVAGLLFQSLGVVAAAYMFWFWLLTIYPASSVASFSFLSPVFSVFMGWWLLGDHVGPSIWGALTLVAVGLVLINRRPA